MMPLSPGPELPADDPGRSTVEDDSVWEAFPTGEDVAQER